MHLSPLHALLPLTLLAATAATQAPTWRTPIHGGTEAHAPDYGVWAAGDGYKVSFHDGVAFYPCLGDGYPHNLPLVWRTEAVTLGAEALVVSPREVRTDWRMEYRYGAWSERYDVRPEGVEQSFLIEKRPLQPGDLRIVGTVSTPLHCAPVSAAHQRLVFRDDAGHPIVEYGQAWAFDADGDKVAVTTAWDGARIELRVDGAWLSQAAFPVLVDPLLAPVVFSQQTGNLTINQIGSTAIGNDHAFVNPVERNTLTACTRIFSASDHDVTAFLSDADLLTNRTLVFQDLSTTYSDRNVTVAFVDGADRWMVGFERETAANSAIRIYFHDQRNTTLNSGLGVTKPQPLGHFERKPDLAGTWLTPDVFGVLTWQDEGTSSTTDPNTAVFIAVVNAAARIIGANVEVGTAAAGTTYDRENPSIEPVSTADPGQGWLVVWQEYTYRILNDDWDIMGMRISPTGAKLGTATLVSGGTRHALTPAIAGAQGSYMLSYGLSADLTSTALTELRVVPVHWALVNATPTVLPSRLIRAATPPLSLVRNGVMAMDEFIGGFFALAYSSTQVIGLQPRSTARIARLTTNGVAAENTVLFADTAADGLVPSVAYAYPAEHYVCAYGSNENTGARAHMLYGRVFDYPPAAGELRYGNGCGAAIIDGNRPWAGNQLYRVSVSSAVPGQLAVLYAGLSPATIPLTVLGLTGCDFLLDPNTLLLSVPTPVSGQGYASVYVPLPDDPLLTGDLYFQYLYLSPGANQAGALMTRGLQALVRN